MTTAKLRMLLAATVGLCLAANSPASAQNVAEFYKGKTIQIIVGFGVGGGYDLYARALGRYLGKYVPGQPTVVVQNLEGAGSVRAANHVYSGSPPDGTVIAAVNQNMPMYQLLGGAGARFEAAGMQWLGSMANSNGLVYTWHTSGIKTLEDAKHTEVPMGAVGNASELCDLPESDQRPARHQVQADHRLCRFLGRFIWQWSAAKSWAAVVIAGSACRPPI